MEKHHNYIATLEEVNWPEARADFLKFKPELAELIDDRKPNKRFSLIRVRYPFGATILKNGVLHLPSEKGDILPIIHPIIPEAIRDKLSYSNFPLGLMTHNGAEVSREANGRLITLRFFQPGIIMGLWEALAPPKSSFPTNIWTVTAGARSIFTLPKIQAETHYARLRKNFDIHFQSPKQLSQQWQLFNHIANHPNFCTETPWYQEMYFFTKEWMQEGSKEMDWIKFHRFLLKEAWEISEYSRNIKNQDVIWDLFANTLATQGRKPNPAHIEILKHIIGVTLGDIPGMKAAGDSEIAAPVKGLQQALIEHYNLKDYVPTIMHPHHFSMDAPDASPVYYSYHASDVMSSSPSSRNPSSTFTELLCIYELMQNFFSDIAAGNLSVANTIFLDMLERVDLTYFHDHATGSYRQKILHTREMPQSDKALIYLDKKYETRNFAESSHFIRGCIRISKK